VSLAPQSTSIGDTSVGNTPINLYFFNILLKIFRGFGMENQIFVLRSNADGENFGLFNFLINLFGNYAHIVCSEDINKSTMIQPQNGTKVCIIEKYDGIVELLSGLEVVPYPSSKLSIFNFLLLIKPLRI
jgi:hypothetical protein